MSLVTLVVGVAGGAGVAVALARRATSRELEHSPAGSARTRAAGLACPLPWVRREDSLPPVGSLRTRGHGVTAGLALLLAGLAIQPSAADAARPFVVASLGGLDRDALTTSGTAPLALRSSRSARVAVALRLEDAGGGALASSRRFSVRLRRGALRRLTLPIGPSIATALGSCLGDRLTATVSVRRRAPVRGAQATAPVPRVPPACGRFFSDAAVWNTPLALGTEVDPASPALTATLQRMLDPAAHGGLAATINTTSYGVPIYTVGPRTRTVPVRLPSPPGRSGGLDRAFAAVPLPPDARPAGGTDGDLVLWQPGTDTMWEFWRLRRASDGWRADWGGRIDNASRDVGYFDGARRGWGTAASGLALAGGVIRVSELRRGHIDHALAMALPETRSGVVAWPAQRSDGRTTGDAAIPEGARFRLDPNVDVNALGLPRTTRILAEAAQRYGIIVTDRGGVVVFSGEDPTPLGANPYPALFEGLAPQAIMARFPWDRLQLVRMDLRTVPGAPPRPCLFGLICS